MAEFITDDLVAAVEADDTLELHLSNIARAEYVSRTGNIAGAKAVSGYKSFCCRSL